MGYRVACDVISVARAEELGKFLAEYAITATGFEVMHITKSGKRVKDAPLADVLTEFAGNVMGNAAASPATGAAACAAGCVVSLPVALAAAAAIPVLLRAQYLTRKKLGPRENPKDPFVASEVSFSLTDVGPKRVQWSEYLLSIYGARHGWHQLWGMRYPRQWEVGASYAARNAGYPPAWGTRREGGSGMKGVQGMQGITPISGIGAVAPVRRSVGGKTPAGSSRNGKLGGWF